MTTRHPPHGTRGSAHPGTLLSLTTLGVASALFLFVLWSRGDLSFGSAERPVEARGELASDELNTIEVFERSSASVVFIRCLAEPGVPPSSGTGIVWDDAGHVVTNYHVIQGHTSDAIRVTLHDQVEYQAEYVGGSVAHDLAVLRIPAAPHRLESLSLGTSGDLRVGQKVFAIGNPFGLDHTLTTGVVSALDRTMRGPGAHRITGVIQTDAAINPGNSGGPLLDSAGRLIGVNTQIYSSLSGSGRGQSAGIGFAIPVDTVNTVVPQLIEHGHVTRPGIGAQLRDHPSGRGSLVLYVVPGGAADRAGLEGRLEETGRFAVRQGDVIVAIDDRPVRNRTDAVDILSEHAVGDTVTVIVARGSGQLTVPITLQELD